MTVGRFLLLRGTVREYVKHYFKQHELHVTMICQSKPITHNADTFPHSITDTIKYNNHTVSCFNTKGLSNPVKNSELSADLSR